MLSMYADDVLLFLTNPLISLPNLKFTLHTIQDLLHLGVNLAKCMAMPINMPPSLTDCEITLILRGVRAHGHIWEFTWPLRCNGSTRPIILLRSHALNNG